MEKGVKKVRESKLILFLILVVCVARYANLHQAEMAPSMRGDIKLRCEDGFGDLPQTSLLGNFTFVVPTGNCWTQTIFIPSRMNFCGWDTSGKVDFDEVTVNGTREQDTDDIGKSFEFDGCIKSVRFRNAGQKEVYVRLK